MFTPKNIYEDVCDLVKESTRNIKTKKVDPFMYMVSPLVEKLEGERNIGPFGLNHAIFIEGDIPLLITCPHGGYRNDSLDYVKRDSRGLDTRSKEYTLVLAHLMQKHLGKRPFVLINELDRQYVELNLKEDNAIRGKAFEDKRVRVYHQWYHSKIEETLEKIVKRFGSGLHISQHTCGTMTEPSYTNGHFYSFRNGIEEGNAEKIIAPLPITTQPQISYPIILGTHLRATVDKARSIDLALSELYSNFKIDGFQRGIPVFVPSETDFKSFLGGLDEIKHALNFKTSESHPIDGVQIEVKNYVYNNSFEWLVFLSLNAMKNILPRYNHR